MLIMEAGSLSLSVFVCVRACVRVVAIAYLLQKTPHVFPIVGGRKVAHLRANIEALTLSLSRAQIARIEGVLPFDPGFPSTLIVRAPPFRSPKKVPLIAEFSVFFNPLEPIHCWARDVRSSWALLADRRATGRRSTGWSSSARRPTSGPCRSPSGLRRKRKTHPPDSARLDE